MAQSMLALLFHAACLFSGALGEESKCNSDIQVEAVKADALLQRQQKTELGVLEEKWWPFDNSASTPRKSALSQLDDLQGPGAYEDLNEAGYQAVAECCCNYQMETFIRRVIDSMDLELCGEGGLMGFVPYYSCEKGVKDYQTLVQELTDGPARTSTCPVATDPGSCPVDNNMCPGEPDPTYHRRRNCKSATTTTTTTTTGEAAAAVATTTLLTTTTFTTTTTLTTTTVTTTKVTTTVLTTTMSTTSGSTTTTVTTTTSTGCKGEIDLFDFFDSSFTHSNLGGAGPDGGAVNMRYEGIGVKDGKGYDMVITADTAYTAAQVLDNGYECGRPQEGCINGRFGAISVAKGTSVDLLISFQDAQTQTPLTLDSFLFSIHDIDQYSAIMKEKIYITGFTGDVIVANNTEIGVTAGGDGRTVIASRQVGTVSDNPTDPLRLDVVGGVDQKKRSAAFLFENVNSIALTFEVTCDACQATTSGELGRTFMFSGDNNLVTCAGRS